MSFFFFSYGFADSSLPEIEARTYPAEVEKISSSYRIYLWKDLENQGTQAGKIIIARKNNRNQMAFRVLKTYPENQTFAAKVIRHYQKTQLDMTEQFIIIEKLRDLPPDYRPTQKEAQQDFDDLEELESGGGIDVASYDAELDASRQSPATEVDEDDYLESLEVHEFKPFDPDWHWLSAELGLFRQFNFTGESEYNFGGGLLYGLTIGKLIFLYDEVAQDSLTIEGGIATYKILNFQSSESDSYTILHGLGTLRYNVFLSESFALYGYGGLIYSGVLTGSNTTAESIERLTGILPAFGGGLIFRIGPRWFLRTNIGFDRFSASAMLRF